MNEPTPSSKLAYTVAEAAEKISLSRSTLYELIHAGEIETIKIGRSRRITERQLATYLVRKEAE
ncbi:MAG: helix-turn-helix domain-containing protein [Armatimonadetes bacterium]|nr:helix-turn-helix domain-containing protein [Armatimonadota bacterium]